MAEFKVQGLKFKVVAFIIFEFLVLNFAPSRSSAELTIKANHDHIKVDFFYHGDEVTVSGTSDPGVDIIVKIASPESHQVFKKKGKMAGLLWMNVGTLNFENVPNLYFLHSTKRIEDILSFEEMDKEIIGYDALMRHTEIKPISAEGDKERWFKEFLRFKEASRIYNVMSGDVIVNEKGNKQDYYIKLPWPYQAQPGKYTVTVYAVKDKRVAEKASTTVNVEQVGIVKTLAQMAKENGALYGIISIIVAIAAGFGVGMIFRKGGAH
ncbi:MAG: TIGR02186 family protein [Thermodesulfovibrionales bacterium]